MKKYISVAVSAAVLMTSAYSFAAAGPTVTKALPLTVKNVSELTADWVAAPNLNNGVAMKATTVGTLNVNAKFIKSVTIASTNAADKTQSGIVTFEKADKSGSFKTTLSSTTSGVKVSNETGQVTIAPTSADADLPNAVAVQFTSVATKAAVPAGDYSATVNLTSVVL